MNGMEWGGGRVVLVVGRGLSLPAIAMTMLVVRVGGMDNERSGWNGVSSGKASISFGKAFLGGHYRPS